MNNDWKKRYINNQIDFFNDIKTCVKERWPNMKGNDVDKISIAIYRNWPVSGINSTLEVIETDLEKL